MTILLFVFFFFAYSSTGDSLLFNVENDFWFPIDRCFEAGFFSGVDQKVTISEDGKSLILVQCDFNTSCSSNCENMMEVDLSSTDYVTNIFSGINWMYGAMFPNLKIGNGGVMKGQPPIAEGQFALVDFGSLESCQADNFNDITDMSYSSTPATLTNGECLNVGGNWDETGMTVESVKCSCNSATHEFECVQYNNTDCSGEGTIQKSCGGDTPLSKVYCGPMDFAPSTENGVLAQMSIDMFLKAGVYPDQYDTTDVIKISAQQMTLEQCDTKTGKQCIEGMNQDYTIGKPVPVQSLLMFYTVFGGEITAYGSKSYEIQKGKTTEDRTDEIYRGMESFFKFNANEYQYCSMQSMKQCLNNGSVIVNTYQDQFCKTLVNQQIEDGTICGTLIKPSSL